MKLHVLFLVLVLPVLLLACALLMMGMPLPRPFPPAMSRGRNLLAAVATGMMGLGYLAGLAVYAVAHFVRAGRVLDPVLVAAGLEPQGYLLVGRQYRGVIEGREVNVTFIPAQVIQSAQLTVTVSADLATRIAIARERPVLECRGCAPLEITDPSWEGLQIVAQDEAAARRLLSDPTGRAVVRRLFGGWGLRELYLQPERVGLRARPRALTAAQFDQVFEDMLALAAAGER
jgi:hypothetical protein